MSESDPKKVLIISYYWPPAGGPGVQRWLKFVKYLPEYDIEPVLYIPENATYPIIDQSLMEEVSSKLTIIKQPIKEPYKLASFFSKGKSETISKGIIHRPKSQSFIEKLMLFVRGNFFIPDARKSWVKPSVKYLKEYLKNNSISTVITTGPPHSMHLIGMALKKDLSIDWIADFRDPWTTIGYHKKLNLSETARKKHLRLEKEVLAAADKIIVTSYNTQQEFKSKTKKPIHIITNGYDEHKIELVAKDSKFTFAHIGSLLSERNPIVLWKVFSDLTKENKEFQKEFQLKLIGIVSQEVLNSLREYDLMDYVKIYGYVSHDEAIKHQMASQLLLLIEIDSEDTKAIIPGKLFEYIKSRTPIIAIGPDGSDVEELIEQTNTGAYYNYHQPLELKNQILSYFEAFKTKTLNTEPTNIDKFSRVELTKKLADLL